MKKFIKFLIDNKMLFLWCIEVMRQNNMMTPHEWIKSYLNRKITANSFKVKLYYSDLITLPFLWIKSKEGEKVWRELNTKWMNSLTPNQITKEVDDCHLLDDLNWYDFFYDYMRNKKILTDFCVMLSLSWGISLSQLISSTKVNPTDTWDREVPGIITDGVDDCDMKGNDFDDDTYSFWMRVSDEWAELAERYKILWT